MPGETDHSGETAPSGKINSPDEINPRDKINPPGEIDLPRVRRIAQLARLELADDEARLLSGQLGTILDYFKQLETVDTAGVQPLYHPQSAPGVPRDDTPHPGLTPTQALSNAPQRHDQFFSVPRVLQQEER